MDLFLKMQGEAEQITVIYADIRNPIDIRIACAGSDVVINLVGILFETRKQKFSDTRNIAAANVAEVSSANNVSA
jgi:uncharacterized protein YbjT (DUF2867 family)